MKLFKLYTNIDTKGKLFKHTEQGYIRMNYFFNQIIPKLEKLSIMQIKITCLQLNKNYKCPFSVRFVKKENNKFYLDKSVLHMHSHCNYDRIIKINTLILKEEIQPLIEKDVYD